MKSKNSLKNRIEIYFIKHTRKLNYLIILCKIDLTKSLYKGDRSVRETKNSEYPNYTGEHSPCKKRRMSEPDVPITLHGSPGGLITEISVEERENSA